MTIEKYLSWRDENGEAFTPVPMGGLSLLNDRILNKGTAFSEREREELGLRGLLPPHIATLDEQIERFYQGICQCSSNIEKDVHLRALQDRNETLFYALIDRYVEEFTPVIYTPTVGLACQQYRDRFQKPRGLYITSKNIRQMKEMVHHFPSKDIKIIVVTDNQGILGIGDQGVGGMGIPIGKLSLYTLGAGIHPGSCLPITLDVGTDNQELLDNPAYLGKHNKRITGAEYDQFIEEFVYRIKEFFPNAILQWEDFSKANAFRNLERYQTTLPSFNDDIQGTGSVALSGIIGAMKIKAEKLKDQSFLVYGAGAGGVGIAKQIMMALIKEGLSEEEAIARIFTLDSRGLILKHRPGLDEYKKLFATPKPLTDSWKVENSEHITMAEVIANHRITVLIGTSGQPNSFPPEMVTDMQRYTKQPVIFPLSNPTSKCEATPEQLYQWSDGQAIVATGSPFDPVDFNGRKIRVGQGNNVFIFPGVGLSALLGKMERIDEEVFTIAAYALADYLTSEDLESGSVYPKIEKLQDVSLFVATKVMAHYDKDGRSEDEIREKIHKWMWKPKYLPYKAV